ncbi:MAG: gentisate 1,2-dioxygenase [Gammaproteobacteria bacterium]|nr:gentisate 1,2-dioxygenase [Gammaproteobacteria bacterium]
MVENRDLTSRAAHVEKTELWKKFPDYYRELEKKHLWPLWEEINKFTGHALPSSKVVPCVWRYEDTRRLVMQSADMLTAAEAERRVLALENPGLEDRMSVTQSMYAGYQLLMPGEVAPSHRHSPAAFRFIMEGEGAYTAVNGEKTFMRPGDFVVTPSWAWHDHGNETETPMIWLDGLDWPLINNLGVWFFESYPEFQHPETRPAGDSFARYGMGVTPVNREHSAASPVLNYTFERTREALETMRRSEDWDPCFGLKTRYTNPLTGEDAMPTISAFMQLLPKNFSSAPYRQTDACVYSVVEGRGHTTIGEVTLEWGPKDAFVIPTWAEHQHFIDDEDTVLFSFSDRGVHEKLGVWRDQRGAG